MPVANDYPRVEHVSVSADEADRRLDNFLLARLKGVPRSRVYRLIRSGEVRVNKRRARANLRLAEGDDVRIPPVRQARPQLAARTRGHQLAWLEQRILFENRELLVLNKPAGLAVHGGSGISLGVIEMLRLRRTAAPYLELVHRLDRETSGCLIIAKRRASLRQLHEQFRRGEVGKRYVTLLSGTLAVGSHVVDAPLRTTHRRGGERYVSVDKGGKASRTIFTVRWNGGGATLADVELLTGRTHQIRVHAAHLGCPVAGDERYAPDAGLWTAGLSLNRLFLHAASVSMRSPQTGAQLDIDCPLDAELANLLDGLGVPAESRQSTIRAR